MGKILVSTQINSSADEAFRIASDFARSPNHISGIEAVEMLTEGEVGPGTRFRETRKIGGREATEEMEVGLFEPGKRYTLICDSCGVLYESEMRFKPAGDGCTVELETNGRPHTLGAKILSPVMGLVMGGFMKKCLAQDLADLKQAAEAQSGA